MGLEKVYLVRRRIFKTINSVNIGRIYTKKRAVWLEFYQQCIGLINSPLALNAAKLCYSKHAFSEKNTLFTLFFRFQRDLVLPDPGLLSGNEELGSKNCWAAPSPSRLENQIRFWGIPSSLWHPNNNFSTTHFQKNTKNHDFSLILHFLRPFSKR